MASPKFLKLLTKVPLLLPANQMFSRRMVSKLARFKDTRITSLPDEILNNDICAQEVALVFQMHIQFQHNKVEFQQALMENPESRAALTTIMKKLRFLNPEQVRMLAHAIFASNLPINLGICKGIMQMIRVHLNEYDGGALAGLYRILGYKKHELDSIEKPERPESPLLDALLQAIPKALEIKIIGKQFHTEDANVLMNILNVAVMNRACSESVKIVLYALSRKLDKINADGCNELILHLSNPWIEINLDKLDRPLVNAMLNHCFVKVSRFLENNNYEMDYYFDKSLYRLFCTSDPMFYNVLYCDTIYKVAENMNTLDNLPSFDAFLAFCLRYDHFSTKTIEKIFQLISEDPHKFLENPQLSSSNIVQILGRLNWRPSNVNWENLSTFLLHGAKLRASHYYSPIQIMKSFLILREHDGFETIAEQDALAYLSTPTVRTIEEEEAFYQDLLTINIGASIEAADSTPDEFVKALEPLTAQAIQYFNDQGCTEFQESLSAFLKLTFGGPQFVATNVWTRQGHHIDNLIAIDENGYPVALKIKKGNDGIHWLDNFDINPKHNLIAVLPSTDDDLCYKPCQIKGEVQLRLRTLEMLGIKPLRIHFDSWDTLSDREKCPYILREIQELIETQIDQEIFKRCYSF